MNVIHVVNVNPGRYVLPYAQRLKSFGFENQTFLPIGTTEKQRAFCDAVDNSCYIPYPETRNPLSVIRFLFSFSAAIDSYDMVIWHSLYFQRIILAFLLLFKPHTVTKSVWLIWGGDLYQWKGKSNVLNCFYRKFVRRLKAAIVIFPPDEKVLRETFDFKKKVFSATYPNHDDIQDLINRSHENVSENDSTVRILIGHSATETMHHKRCLDLLARFKSEDIMICLPLSYGTPSYADEVEAYAKEIFGPEKVLALREYMPLDAYMDFLKSVDVAVFDSERQIALGNIYPLMYMKKPIYLTREGIMFQYFNEINLSVKAIDELEQVQALSDMLYDVSEENYTFAKQYYNMESFHQEWEKIFHELQS